MVIGTFVSPDTLADGRLGWCGYFTVFHRFNVVRNFCSQTSWMLSVVLCREVLYQGLTFVTKQVSKMQDVNSL